MAKHKAKPRDTETLKFRIVLDLEVYLKKGYKFDEAQFEDELIDGDYDFQQIVEGAMNAQDDFEGSWNLGPIFIEEVSGIDRLIEEMRRKIKRKFDELGHVKAKG